MDFAARVVRWQQEHGRHGLPWQGTRDPYRIWLSEIMLQQTQVATVIPYYQRFLARCPDVATLAVAPEDDVLALWSGLGYYARARNLHKAAKEVVARFGGRFPTRFDDLESLPGIGRSTAGAIAAFSSGEVRPILDGNVRRVLSRHAGIPGNPSSALTQSALWAEATQRLPRHGIEQYTQGLMDLGADICRTRTPACLLCPVAEDCIARLEDRIDELPGKRARAAPRRKRIAMLVIVLKGEVLLEKRPASGIWGSLWSLPEIDEATDPQVALGGWGFTAATIVALEPFEHAFTHYTLDVFPWRIEVGKAAPLAAQRAAIWLPLAEITGAALPSPVRRLLKLVSDTTFSNGDKKPPKSKSRV
ncbi:MAG: A/G-specific adenine glycosylase [Usitatibacter sp.]